MPKFKISVADRVDDKTVAWGESSCVVEAADFDSAIRTFVNDNADGFDVVQLINDGECELTIVGQEVGKADTAKAAAVMVKVDIRVVGLAEAEIIQNDDPRATGL